MHGWEMRYNFYSFVEIKWWEISYDCRTLLAQKMHSYCSMRSGSWYWISSVFQPCTNPDCLYLHEIGSQEDSFPKDEMVSAYTRYFMSDFLQFFSLNFISLSWTFCYISSVLSVDDTSYLSLLLLIWLEWVLGLICILGRQTPTSF